MRILKKTILINTHKQTHTLGNSYNCYNDYTYIHTYTIIIYDTPHKLKNIKMIFFYLNDHLCISSGAKNS